jgi:hypothetical protein
VIGLQAHLPSDRPRLWCVGRHNPGGYSHRGGSRRCVEIKDPDQHHQQGNGQHAQMSDTRIRLPLAHRLVPQLLHDGADPIGPGSCAIHDRSDFSRRASCNSC